MSLAERALVPQRAGVRDLPTARATPADEPRIGRVALALLIPPIVALLAAAAGAVSFRAALGVPLALGVAALVRGWTRPPAAVLGLVLLAVLDAPLRVFLLDGAPLPWNTVNYVLLVGLVVQAPRVVRLDDVHSWLLLALIALLALGLLVSDDVVTGAQHTLAAVASFGMLLAFVRAGSAPALQRWMALVAGGVGAAGGLAFYLDGLQLGGINPNAWALTPLTALIGVCLGIDGVRDRRARVAVVLLVALNLAWVFLSGSRGSLVVALCCVLHLLWASGRHGGRLVTLGAIVAFTTLLAARFPELREGTLHRLRKTFETEAADARQVSLSERTSGRSDLALGGWYIFLEHPLGVGTGGFASAWERLGARDGLSDFGRGERKSAHAGWILTMAENGIPGVLLLAGWVLSFTLSGRRDRDPRARGLASLATAAIALHLLFAEFQSKGLWLLAAGTTAALHYGAGATAARGARRPDGR